jgi:hypothetical protein
LQAVQTTSLWWRAQTATPSQRSPLIV